MISALLGNNVVNQIAFDVDNMKQSVDAMLEHDFSIVQTGEFTSSKGRYAYMDTTTFQRYLLPLKYAEFHPL